MATETVDQQPPLKRQKSERESLLAPSRIISKSLRLNVTRHPLNIKPEGNLIFAGDEELIEIQNSTGPFFNKLPDQIILKIILNLDSSKDLLNLSHTSKFFYGFVSFEEIWKNLYVNSTASERLQKKLDFQTWKGTWKKSILKLMSTAEIDCGDILYSNLLYVPYQNSQVDYSELFKNLIEEQHKLIDYDGYYDANLLQSPHDYPYKGRIPRIEENSMTLELFEKNWSNHPFIMSSNVKTESRWPDWTVPFLVENFPHDRFRQESVEWPLALYSEYSDKNIDENPLYLFDCKSQAMKQLIPEGKFSDPPIYAKNDLFDILGDCRPDHTWLIMGSERSGSTFHKDPNSTDAWNTVFVGSKLWLMLPPGMKPPGIYTDEDESEVTSPLGLAEWVLSGFYNDSVKLSDEARDENGNSCVIGITFKDECMYVPSGWWHTVINLEDSVALTSNFIPACKLGESLNFMKNKKNQLSGFHHNKFHKFLQGFLNNENILQDIDENRLEIFKKYLQENELADEDEDIGELKCQIDLPVFELFVELLKNHGYERELEKGLQDLASIENETKLKKGDNVKKSEAWEKLTEKKNSGFSFQFDFNDGD